MVFRRFSLLYILRCDGFYIIFQWEITLLSCPMVLRKVFDGYFSVEFVLILNSENKNKNKNRLK